VAGTARGTVNPSTISTKEERAVGNGTTTIHDGRGPYPERVV
jgi:hypothetical protein